MNTHKDGAAIDLNPACPKVYPSTLVPVDTGPRPGQVGRALAG